MSALQRLSGARSPPSVETRRLMDDGYLHIHECAWVLRNDTGDRCGFIQRGPGPCPYDHGEPVALDKAEALST